MSSTSMIKVGSDGIQLQDFNSMQRFCSAAVESGMFQGVRDVSQAIMKVEYGLELGIKPITAMRNIYYFQNAFCLSASLVNALIKRAGYRFSTVERTDERCLLRFESPDGKPLGDSEFTWKDAIKKNLTTKKNWREHPKNMLFARSLTQGANMYCAEVFLGPVLTPEELLESNSASNEMPPEAPPLEILVSEGETIKVANEQPSVDVVDVEQDREESSSSSPSPIVEVLERSIEKKTKEKSNGETKKNGSDSRSAASIMKNFMMATDTCNDSEELDEVLDAWKMSLDDLPRGRENCIAYWRVAVSDAGAGSVDDETRAMASKLDILKQ